MIDRVIYFALDDTGQKPGVMNINLSQAEGWNKLFYGIFWIFNEFKDNQRKKENLIKINTWVLDIDAGHKEQQLKRIENSPLNPSMIIETKKGHHLYWFAKDATLENYSAVVESRLVPFFGADIRAKDVCRILRVPGFYHCKDPNDKFMVKTIRLENTSFSEDEMLTFFKPKIEIRKKATPEMRMVNGNGFWEKVASLPLDYALNKLSGHESVNYERFELKPNRNGTFQIYVNGKSSSSWVDRDGLIGSYDRGGVTISQWLNWYLRDYGRTVEVLKEIFKEDLCKN